MNGVISSGEKERLLREVINIRDEASKYGGKVLVDRSGEELPGNCIGPVVVELPPERAYQKDSYAQRELFGPIVHILPFNSLEEGVKMANSVEFALTGGVFSQSQEDIDYIANRFEVGNLYINRTNTGARVAIEPFGGFKYSGTGPKAGSADYLNVFKSFKEERNLSSLSLVNESSPEQAFDLSNFNWRLYQKHIDHSLWQNLEGWAKKNLNSMIKNKHLNRVIPGQQSYDDYKIIKDRGLFLFSGELPDFKLMASLYLAKKLGVKCHALFLSTEAREVYQQYFETELPQHDTSNLEWVIKEYAPDEVFSDLSVEHLKQVLPSLFPEQHQAPEMYHLLNSWELPLPGDWDEYIKPFVKIRSIAKNTMRYGAELDLTEEKA